MLLPSLIALAGLCLLLATVQLLDGLWALRRQQVHRRAGSLLRLRVVERHDHAADLFTVTLARPGLRKALPPFRAGQHVLIEAGRTSAGPLRRAYSLSGWQRQPRSYQFGIRREAEGRMSPLLADLLHPGALVCVSRPRGDFLRIASSERKLVLIAGGIGITPLRAMVHEALADGQSVLLFHAVRHEAELLYRSEFEALAQAEPPLSYRPAVSRPGPTWAGLRGRLDAASVLAEVSGPAQFCLCAGPGLQADMQANLQAAGVPPADIHTERFGLPAQAGEHGHSITVALAGQTRQLLSAGEPTLLGCLEAQRLPIQADCRAGDCLSCRCTLTAGAVTWLVDSPWPDDPTAILPCVCAVRSSIHIRLAAPVQV